MRSDYSKIVLPQKYWEKLLQSDDDTKIVLLMLIDKIDKLNERVYEANVRAEDAYNEVIRLRAELAEKKNSY